MSQQFDEFEAKAKEVEVKILALQKAKADAVAQGGMPAAEEVKAKALLDRLSVIADPEQPNPPGVPADPNQP